MAGHSGQFYILGIGKQTAKGTPQTTPKMRVRLTGGAVVPDPQLLDLPETDSSIQRSNTVKVGQQIAGAIEGFIRTDEIPLLAYAALGANNTTGVGPYVHTATATNAAPYMTLYSVYDSTALVDRYSDMRISEFTVRGGANQALGYTATWLGITADMGQTDPGTPAPSAVDPLVYPNVLVTLGGSTSDIVESFEITSTKVTEAIQGDTGMVPSDIVHGRWSVAGTMTILFETDAKWRLWLTGATGGTVSSPTLATEALTILCQRTALTDEVSFVATAIELRQIGLAPDPSGSPLRMTYAFSMKPQVTIANTFSIVTKNNVTTY